MGRSPMTSSNDVFRGVVDGGPSSSETPRTRGQGGSHTVAKAIHDSPSPTKITENDTTYA
ncbi:protein of unknown function [Azospirillum baldaniorum]|uniref:Uncharacterized protein n=1 Tax=Azospirillum baldaniorum TaxID=1064539 RepID=A0A9P1JRD7_9PROT|nr:protein of unknown function [Azospirillum baldaniorum]